VPGERLADAISAQRGPSGKRASPPADGLIASLRPRSARAASALAVSFPTSMNEHPPGPAASPVSLKINIHGEYGGILGDRFGDRVMKA
jgi:hypothetical protein